VALFTWLKVTRHRGSKQLLNLADLAKKLFLWRLNPPWRAYKQHWPRPFQTLPEPSYVASCMSSRTVFTLCASRTINAIATISITQKLCFSDIRCACSMCLLYVRAGNWPLLVQAPFPKHKHTHQKGTHLCSVVHVKSNCDMTLLHSPFIIFRTRLRQSTTHVLTCRTRLPAEDGCRIRPSLDLAKTLCRSKEHS
jgi:hypothetical protein